MVDNFLHFQRPSERVERFLQEYLTRQSRLNGERLPSTRAIAKKLQISEGTVRNVLKRYKQQSTFSSKKGSGIFLSKNMVSAKRIHIGTNAGVLDFAQIKGYNQKVLQAAFNEAMKLGPKISLTSIFTEKEYLEIADSSKINERCKDLDAIVISQSMQPDSVVEACRHNKKPYVFLNAPDHLSLVNFISLDHRESFYKMTKAFVATGRKRFAVLIYPSIERSMSIRQRLEGLFSAIGVELGKTISVRLAACADWRETGGYEATRQLLKEGYQPDVVLTPGDLLAIGAKRALEEDGLSIPKEVSLVAGNGVEPETAELNLTRLNLPVEKVGTQAIAMLVEMVERQLLELPGRFLDIPLTLGASTRKNENALLQETFSCMDLAGCEVCC